MTAFPRRSERFVLHMAVLSRVVVFMFGLVSTALVGPFDTSTSLLVGDSKLVPGFVQCPANWDGAFNLRIAEQGYLYEQAHAFFPLFPLITRLSVRALGTERSVLVLALSGSFINNAAFIVTCGVFHRLGLALLKDERLALGSSLLFCFNPASIFFSVAYSESLFSLFAFTGLWLLYHHADAPPFPSRLAATLCFSLATLTRSNGSLLGIFSIHAAYLSWQANHSHPYRTSSTVVELGIVGGIHLCSLMAVLGYGWYLYCFLPIPIPIPDDESVRPWCNKLLPNIYTFVEGEYWNIGLFTYYQWKNLPNFVLAAPAWIIAVQGVKSHAQQLVSSSGTPIPTRTKLSPFYLQMAVIVVIASMFMHIQVLTRMICASCPAFYWKAAEYTQQENTQSYLVILYFTCYLALGTSMFCNYFPWT